MAVAAKAAVTGRAHPAGGARRWTSATLRSLPPADQRGNPPATSHAFCRLLKQWAEPGFG